jgi:CyaY protein
LAAQSGGYHYRFDGAAWQDTKGQCEFWQQFTLDAQRQFGATLIFKE